MASKVVSLRFGSQQMERLQRVARRLGRTPSETGALLVEEALRRTEFALIDFRDSIVGRQAYLQGSSLAVWEVVMVGRGYGMDAVRTAEHLQWPLPRVQAAFRYAEAFADEIEAALTDNASYTFEDITRMLPQARQFVLPASVFAEAHQPLEPAAGTTAPATMETKRRGTVQSNVTKRVTNGVKSAASKDTASKGGTAKSRTNKRGASKRNAPKS
ncbi:MAG TPA: hypothetical protein VNM48_17710 [Chloroflexota bacterium]|nr:hypothetical protein [Chloroflexota bacterium]